ncbi:MAG: hypothetical protein V3T72_21060 [Thermoanaerobaculia bacterium]
MSNDTKKGLSPLAWVAIGCGALALVVFIGVVAVGGFAFFKAKEIVDDAVEQYEKDGTISIPTPEGNIEIDTSDEGGAIKVTSKDGSEVTWGGSASLENVPEWVQEMLYPNATETQGTFNTSTPDGVTGIVSITTDDAPEEVAGFFKKKLEDAGYEITNESTMSTPQGKIATVAGEDAGEGRTLNVSVVQNDDQTQVTIHYNDKNSTG